ncbi:Phenolphthiocerol/phthiocerol polyketide synthase subunit E [Frankliniella fusca]|uniref:Phenolphthiocerol/phthiocerol polyketide synthase subunit E n=1 Tax=Frankliniella fusca TaxID=407009 RepID=A0AAE1H8F8_9NEOP|nr:Phenolphthiocerol/phthiocerol polyketide synthase subunit E [Frankliniella fusca]
MVNGEYTCEEQRPNLARAQVSRGRLTQSKMKMDSLYTHHALHFYLCNSSLRKERVPYVSWLTSLLHAEILSSRFDQQANSPGSWTKLALKPLLLKRIQNASLETCVRHSWPLRSSPPSQVVLLVQRLTGCSTKSILSPRWTKS